MNIANKIIEQGKINPDKDAIRFPIKEGSKYRYDSLTFKELNLLSDHYANCLTKSGIKKGDKVLLFVKQSLDFPTITFTLFKMGAIPILIDPGMGKKNLLNAIKQVKPKVLIAEPIVLLLKILYPKYFKSIKNIITTKSIPLISKESLNYYKRLKQEKFDCVKCDNSDMAAILFTSGGTGIPKGVVYTHGIFNNQTETLKDIFHLNESQVDVPGFPLFSFFTMAMGMTSCIPDMNPSKPAQCDPQSIIQNIEDNRATFVAGSPAIWDRVGNYCIENKIQLNSVKYVVMFGAPVENRIHKMWAQIVPNGNTYTPYGATECLPVSNIDGQTILKETSHQSDEGHGTCIGYPAPNIEVKIIRCTDDILKNYSKDLELTTDEIGEIIVKGPFVTPFYYEMPLKTEEAKIYEGNEIWHRMGDLGRLDKDGRLWFYGRKTHRVNHKNTTLYSIACESVYKQIPEITKCALIKTSNGPGLILEENKYIKNKRDLRDILKIKSSNYDHTNLIKNFYMTKNFPVDVRHNIKIDRLKLSEQVKTGRVKEI